MRFASTTRPALTPLGFRLLSISESKLVNLESPYGSRDDASTLRKGVVVREAIRSAWRTVAEGHVAADLNDWAHASAMGLDVVSEEDDDEGTLAVRSEERWFEDLVSAFGDDDNVPEDVGRHEWMESSVASAFDDVEYDDEGMEAFTLMSSSAASPPHSPDDLPTRSDYATFDDHDLTTVTVAAVHDLADDEEEEDYEDVDEEDGVYDGDDEDAAEWATATGGRPSNSLQFDVSSYMPPLSFATPIPSAVDPASLVGLEGLDAGEFGVDHLLPPPLVHRSGSWSSSPSSSEDEEGCITPPARSPSYQSVAIYDEDRGGYDKEEEDVGFYGGAVKSAPAASWTDAGLAERFGSLNLGR